MATPRTCSRCGIPGHTKRHCLLPRKEEEVLIRTSSEAAPSSRHILSLRQHEQPRAWDAVETYDTPIYEEPKRVVLDFAQLVREEAPVPDIFVHPSHPVSEHEEEVQEDVLIEERVLPASFSVSVEADSDVKAESFPVSSVIYSIQEEAQGPSVEEYEPVLLQPLTDQSKRTWFARKAKPKTVAAKPQVLQVTWATPQVRRFMAGALAFVILLTVPLPAKGYVERLKVKSNALVEESTNGFLALQSSTVAALGANIPKAGEDLTKALQTFESVEQKMQNDYGFLLGVGKWIPIVGKHIESRQHLLEAGQHVALGNTYVLKGMQDIVAQKDSAFTIRLQTLRTHLRSALPQYQAALMNIESVQESSLPVEYRETFASAKQLFTVFVNDVEDVVALSDALEKVLGDTSFKRYLVVFQNHHELRPTGGFVGSFAIVDIQKGTIKRIEVPKGGSYDVQGQFSEYLRPPVPLQLANGRFEFQDANWWPDFAVSGEKLADFYEASRQETVDGVIAVNATVLERVLSVLGPIQSEEFQVVMNQYDALEKLQEHVESDAQRDTGEPKAILSNMLHGLMKQLPSLGKADLVKLMTEFHAALAEKEIQVYFRDTDIQETFREFGWTGELAQVPPSEDYLMVVGANIQGQKSDAKVKQTVSHTATIAANGVVEDTVVIKRQHIGVSDGSLYGVPNIEYIRVYVPLGAELVSTEGFRYPPEAAFKVPEIWYRDDVTVEANEVKERLDELSGTSIGEESGRTVFGNWMIVSPGDTAEAKITYRLPRPLTVKGQEIPNNRFEAVTNDIFGKTPTLRLAYILNVEKQSGITPTFESRIVYPSTWNPSWRAHDDEVIEKGALTYKTMLTTSERVGAIFERPYEK